MLLDTSGRLCWHHVDEAQHGDAVTLFGAAETRLTQGYVLAGFVTRGMVRGLPGRKTLAFVMVLREQPDIEVVWVDEDLDRRAMGLLEARLDKTYSLCDAVSFELMRQRGATEALRIDHHFEQEGFLRRLRPGDPGAGASTSDWAPRQSARLSPNDRIRLASIRSPGAGSGLGAVHRAGCSGR